MDTPRYLKEIIADGACPEAVAWARAYPTAEAMWSACERVDWMLWLAGRRAGPAHSASRVRIVRVACETARLALRHVPAGEDRPRLAIEAAEAYCAAPSDAARAASAAASDAARAASAAASDAARAAARAASAAAWAASDAAWAARAASDAARAAALAASDASDAARAAALAASDAAWAASDAAWAATKAESLAIVRRHYPTMPERSES